MIICIHRKRSLEYFVSDRVLTRGREEAVKKELPEDLTALMIPNKEIREIFETTVKKWFSDHAREWNREKLFEAVWNGDSEKLTAEMTRLLRRTISYHDYREDFYHAFLAVFLPVQAIV